MKLLPLEALPDPPDGDIGEGGVGPSLPLQRGSSLEGVGNLGFLQPGSLPWLDGRLLPPLPEVPLYCHLLSLDPEPGLDPADPTQAGLQQAHSLGPHSLQFLPI